MKLQQLSIRHFLLLDSLDLDLGEGLIVITGETGAGKSILLKAIACILGAKAPKDWVRNGCTSAHIAATFDLDATPSAALTDFCDQNGIALEEEEPQLIIRRQLTIDGKSRAFVNDTPVGIQLLKTLGEHLIEMHTQHAVTKLQNPVFLRELYDQLAGVSPLYPELNSRYHAWQDAIHKLEEIQALKHKNETEIAYFKHVAQELKSLEISEGEEDQLLEARTKIKEQTKQHSHLQDALRYLYGSQELPLESSLQKALQYMDAEMEPAYSLLTSALSNIQEATALLEEKNQAGSQSEQQLEEIENRLHALRAISRKYHKPLVELIAFEREINERIYQSEHADELAAKLTKDISVLKSAYLELAKEASSRRKSFVKQAEQQIHAQLVPLKLEHSRIQFELLPLSDSQYHAFGIDQLSLLVSMNPGIPVQPLHKVASGGELSRFMLALTVLLASHMNTPILVFDEIDTGVGGAVAEGIGSRLAALAEHAQVFTITHQPQVAAKAHHHILVSKEIASGHTVTQIKLLNDQEKREEIARMLSGNRVTDHARAQAEELMC